ncbi:hypothetical protein [Mycobacterium sp. URHB0021]
MAAELPQSRHRKRPCGTICGVAGVIVYSVKSALPGGTIPTIPSFPSMPSYPTVAPPEPGGQISVAGVGDHKAIECNDSLVSVSGVSNTVTITPLTPTPLGRADFE